MVKESGICSYTPRKKFYIVFSDIKNLFCSLPQIVCWKKFLTWYIRTGQEQKRVIRNQALAWDRRHPWRQVTQVVPPPPGSARQFVKLTVIFSFHSS